MDLSAIKLKIISFFKNIKIGYLLLLVGLIIILEAVWAYKTLVSSNAISSSTSTKTQPILRKASNVISLTVPKNEFKVGEKIPVAVNIKSNKFTAGVDLIIKYDPNLLAVIMDSNKAPVAVRSIYEDYPVNQVDEKTGLITISGITNKTMGVIPKGVFGTIVFQGKAVGNARIFLEFTKDNTGDTNIIENQTATDVLEEVQNLDLKITP